MQCLLKGNIIQNVQQNIMQYRHFICGKQTKKCISSTTLAPVTILLGKNSINHRQSAIPITYFSRILLWFRRNWSHANSHLISTFWTLDRPIISQRCRQIVILSWLVTTEITCKGWYYNRPDNCKHMCQFSVVLCSNSFDTYHRICWVIFASNSHTY